MQFRFKKLFCFSFAAAIAIFTLAFIPNAHAAGVCGYANGNPYSSAPQAVGSLCATGTASAVSGSGPWNWTCTDGASTVNCSSGLCGVTFAWQVGTFSNCDCATSLQSRGVWCYRNGVMTDPDQSGCYANAGPKPDWQQSCTPSGCVVPVAGACDNSTVNGCSAGSAFNISSDASNDYWQCSGSGGGANSGQCQKAKPAEPTSHFFAAFCRNCSGSCYACGYGVGYNPELLCGGNKIHETSSNSTGKWFDTPTVPDHPTAKCAITLPIGYNGDRSSDRPGWVTEYYDGPARPGPYERSATIFPVRPFIGTFTISGGASGMPAGTVVGTTSRHNSCSGNISTRRCASNIATATQSGGCRLICQ